MIFLGHHSLHDESEYMWQLDQNSLKQFNKLKTGGIYIHSNAVPLVSDCFFPEHPTIKLKDKANGNIFLNFIRSSSLKLFDFSLVIYQL